MIALTRSLPRRNESVGTPSIGAIVAWWVKTTRDVVRENFAKTRPVARAVTRSPVTDSAATSTCAAALAGYIAPYPIVPIVWMLKANASANEPARAPVTPPLTRKRTAKHAFSAR